jgi:uncharacterized protein
MRAIAAALMSTEAHLRSAYDKATMKYDDAYQEVLWAMADHFELIRNAKSVYDTSYQRIMELRQKPPLSYEQFKSRINNMKMPRHGEIVASDRANWFHFRENMIRGYVRLRAEGVGVRLALEHE